MGFFDPQNASLLKPKFTTGCSSCKLFQTCASPCMNSIGTGSNGILLLLPPPSKHEDVCGVVGSNDLNQWLFRKLADIGIDYKECTVVNSLGCYTEAPKGTNFAYCINRINNIVAKVRPKLVISFGTANLQSTVKPLWSRNLGDILKWHGWCIPWIAHNCWLVNTFSPEDILYQDSFYKNEKWKVAKTPFEKEEAVQFNGSFKIYLREFYTDITNAYKKKDTPLPVDPAKLSPAKTLNQEESIKWLSDACRYLLNNPETEIVVDLETNGLKCYNKDKFIYSVSCIYDKIIGAGSFLLTNANRPYLEDLLKLNPKIRGANYKYDYAWIKTKLRIDAGNLVNDVMILSHLIDNRDGCHSLKFQTLVQFGIAYEDTVHSYLEASGTNGCNRIHEAPVYDLLHYGALDAIYSDYCIDNLVKIYDSLDVPKKDFAKKLYHKGAIALSKIEINGMHIDLQIAEKSRDLCDKKLREVDKAIVDEPVWKEWQEIYKEKASLLSDTQIIDIFINRKGLWPTGISRREKPRTDHEFLSKMVDKEPFLRFVLEKRKWEKNRNTYLESYFVETNDDNRIRCFYNNASVSTHRIASNSPNMMNQPTRSQEQCELLKSCFTPKSKDYVLVSVDWSGLENVLSANITNDPYMIDTIIGGTDMHKSNSQYLFFCSDEEFDSLKKYDEENHKKMAKSLRNVGKTGSFSALFGAAAPVVATQTWKVLDELDIHVTPTETAKKRLIERLNVKEKYAKSDKKLSFDEFAYQEYEKHCTNFLDVFWNDRMCVTKKWRDTTFKEFVDRGRIAYPVGLSICGIMSRNASLNSPVQGTGGALMNLALLRAFYLLDENPQVDANLVGQIHDDILAEVHRKDVHAYVKLIKRAMCEDTQKILPDLLKIPLQAEPEICEVSWADKKEYDPNRDYTKVD